MKLTSKRLAALTLAGLVAATGMAGVAAPAYAADDPATPVIEDGGIAITPTAGAFDQNPMLETLTTTLQCPTGYRARANTVVWYNNEFRGSLGLTWNADTLPDFGNGGLTGPVDLSIEESFGALSDKALADIDVPLTGSGVFEIRRYCWADANVVNYNTDRYFSLPVTFDAAAGTWQVQGPAQAEQAVISNFTVVGNANGTVTAAASVQAAAAGKIEFYTAGTTTKVGEGVVLAGNASWTSGVVPAGTYSYDAKFISSNPATFTNSAVAGPVSVTTTGSSVLYEGTPANVEINVEVPATIENNGLKLTVANTSVNLGLAAVNAGNYVATGDLGAVTVTDSRQTKSGWNVTGVNSVFTNQADNTKTIDAKALGWTPAVVSTEDSATAGAAVAAWTEGLATAKPLASAAANSLVGTKVTSADADLAFSVPANGSVAPGTYKSTLTLTLI